MNKEILKNQILIQHGIIKGLEKQLKTFNIEIDKLTQNAQEELKRAIIDYRHFGGFEDCGGCYNDSKFEAEGQLKAFKGINFISIMLINNIKKESYVLKDLKQKYISTYGQIDFDENVHDFIHMIQKDKHNKFMEEKKQEKIYYESAKNLVSIIFSNGLTESIRNINYDLYLKIKNSRKNKISFDSNTDFVSWKMSDFKNFFNKHKENLMENLFIINDFLNSLDNNISEENFKNKLHYKSMKKLLNYKAIFTTEFHKIN